MKVERLITEQALDSGEASEEKLNSTKINQSNQTQLSIETNISSSLTSPVLASENGMKIKVIAKKVNSNPYDKPIPPKCFSSLPGYRSNECPNSKLNAFVGENHEGDT
ncbi:hypothetical protein Tco_0511506 [Tanacetum coccineum]